MNTICAISGFGLILCAFSTATSAQGGSGADVVLQGGIDQGRHYSLKSVNAPRDQVSRDDREIEQEIAKVLTQDGGLKGSLHAESHGGWITLVGELEDTGMLYRAIALVERVAGVRGVNEEEVAVR